MSLEQDIETVEQHMPGIKKIVKHHTQNSEYPSGYFQSHVTAIGHVKLGSTNYCGMKVYRRERDGRTLVLNGNEIFVYAQKKGDETIKNVNGTTGRIMELYFNTIL